MATFTSSLPDKLLKQLAQMAEELKVPKNKLIQQALETYLEHLEKKKFLKSYERMANDPEMLSLAEEGMADYAKMLDKLDQE